MVETCTPQYDLLIKGKPYLSIDFLSNQFSNLNYAFPPLQEGLKFNEGREEKIEHSIDGSLNLKYNPGIEYSMGPT